MQVGIPVDKIFIINPKGIISQLEKPEYQSTYTELAEETEELFPALASRNGRSKSVVETIPRPTMRDVDVENGPPSSSLHLLNKKDRSYTQRIKDKVRRTMTRVSEYSKAAPEEPVADQTLRGVAVVTMPSLAAEVQPQDPGAVSVGKLPFEVQAAIDELSNPYAQSQPSQPQLLEGAANVGNPYNQ